VDLRAVTAPALARLQAAGYSPSLEVREGEPGPEIAQFANDGRYDLVLIGSDEKGLLRRRILGSVAHKVIARCRVPVLIVR
jgi:nucleotide-binding universal stress UspA family protein